ncbi:hypothetical protein RintRC_3732 [Richelia intracellularis]|nr:hypothetical protein RintRC_3732 [Richelia intracellularis]
MIYSGYGSKVNSFEELPELLQEQLSNNVPLYKEAAKGFLYVEDITSWLSFQLHFEDYLAGKTFPFPAKSEDEETMTISDTHSTQDAETVTVGIAP